MNVMKKCCGLCPYSKKNTLFLHPSRAEEFGYHAENPYNDFICHKTGITDEDHPDEERQSDIVRGERSLTCAGFHAMQHIIKQNRGHAKNCEIEIDHTDHFGDTLEMEEHHRTNTPYNK